MFDVLIKNAKIVSSQEIIEGNLYIRDEKIAAVSRELLDEGAAKVIDAAGKYAMPGVVDEHVHIIDMGQPELGKYELDSGGAAVGGITTVLEMPLSMPPSTTLENFKKKEERAGSAFVVDYGLYGGAVPGNLEEMYKINDAGCIGFKAMMAGSVPGMFDVADDGSLLEIFRAIKEMDSTIGVHAENDALIHIEEQHLKAAGRKDITAYLDSRSEFQENEAVRRAIYLNSDPECRLIIVHASNPGAVDIIHQAKAEDHNVHCETGPHYLALCKEDGPKIGPYMKFAPPAREKAQTDILWQQLAEGKIDTIGSDHGGHTKENKEKGWADIWQAGNGALGLETSLPVMLTEGVNKGRITMQKLVEVMCENPAKLFRIFPKKGTLQVGADADVVLVDLDKEYTVDAAKFHSVVRHSPFNGFAIKGAPVLTMVRGTVVAENGEVVAQPGHGKMVRPIK